MLSWYGKVSSSFWVFHSPHLTISSAALRDKLHVTDIIKYHQPWETSFIPLISSESNNY